MITRKCTLLVLESVILAFATAASVGASDWPRWRGPNGDGISTETDWDPAALAQSPKILWTFNTGMSSSNVAIRGEFLYTMGGTMSTDAVFCIDIKTGKQVWKYSYECRKKPYGPSATPTIDGDFVYTLSTEGHLYCINAKKGKVQWYKHLVEDYHVVRPFHGFSGSPVVEGNLVIITGNTFGIALDKKKGKIVWTSPPLVWKEGYKDSTGSEYATPLLYTQNNKRYAAVFNTLGLSSVDVGTGEPSWTHPWPPEDYPLWVNTADPILFDGKIFISTGYEVGCALLDISSGTPKVLWRNKNMNNHFSTCVLIDGFLYGCHGQAGFGSGVMRCLDVKNGKVAWEKNFKEPVCLSAADRKLLILTDRGKLHIAEASPKSYQEIASARIFEISNMKIQCWTPPVLCGGRIYIHELSGRLICVDVRR
jgi:outer membrane protein assembly factor BamB